MQLRIVLWLSCWLLAPTNLDGQDYHNYGIFRFFSLHYSTGWHIYTGTDSSDGIMGRYNSFELKAGWQSKRSQEWAREVNHPSYGFGLYYGLIGDKQVFGRPSALFGFIAFPVTRERRLNFQLEPAAGIAFNLKPYDSSTNKNNLAYGARFAFYFALQAEAKYYLNRKTDLLFGLNIHHISNGRAVQPNLGLNMVGLRVGASYHFNGMQKKMNRSTKDTVTLPVRPCNGLAAPVRRVKEHNISIYQAFGMVQNRTNIESNTRYLTSSSVLEFQHKFNSMHGVSAGFDAFLDYGMRDTAEYHAPEPAGVFFPGIHAGYDLMFWRLSARFQVGYHTSAAGRELKGALFFRPNIRFDFNDRLFAQIGLKTRNGGRADWIETGLGYKIWRQRKPS